MYDVDVLAVEFLTGFHPLVSVLCIASTPKTNLHQYGVGFTTCSSHYVFPRLTHYMPLDARIYKMIALMYIKANYVKVRDRSVFKGRTQCEKLDKKNYNVTISHRTGAVGSAKGTC